MYRWVGGWHRCAEDREHGVALKLVDRAVVALDDVDDNREELVERCDECLGETRSASREEPTRSTNNAATSQVSPPIAACEPTPARLVLAGPVGGRT
jgi:hypothetical protein